MRLDGFPIMNAKLPIWLGSAFSNREITVWRRLARLSARSVGCQQGVNKLAVTDTSLAQ
jgi:hypothetical protein